MKNIYKVHNVDARQISTIVKDQIVDVTITSPPYFDLKDYESKDHIKLIIQKTLKFKHY